MNLRLDHLVFGFGGRAVLRDLSGKAEGSKVLGIVGPSGGGKSTLLRVLAGLITPDSGSVLWEGEPMSFGERDLLRYRRKVGTVFQAFNLFPHLSALENIALPLREVHGFSAFLAQETAEKQLDRFRLLDHRRKKPGELSGGQSQRVAIARALASGASRLFFDEPTSALDPEMTYEVLEAIREVKQEGRDLVLVTHEIGFAREIADELWFLSKGKIVEGGDPEGVIKGARTGEARRFFDKILRW